MCTSIWTAAEGILILSCENPELHLPFPRAQVYILIVDCDGAEVTYIATTPSTRTCVDGHSSTPAGSQMTVKVCQPKRIS